MDELRQWAAQNCDNSERFWLEFADRVCNVVKDGRATLHEVSSLYALYENKNDIEAWM
jgi:hypothetical protein